MSHYGRILLFFSFALSVATGQVPESAYVVIDSPANARFVVNGELSSASAGDTIVVPPGRVIVERIPLSLFEWTAHRVVDTVTLGPSEIRVVSFSGPLEHLIQTRPSGADILRNGKLIGVTPYRFAHSESGEAELELRRQGYESVLFRPTRPAESFELTPLSSPAAGSDPAVRSISPSLNNKALTIASGILMIASSFGAAYLKEQANTSLDEYYRTRDPRALENVRRYDRLSGYAAVSMQLSFAGFAILLTSR